MLNLYELCLVQRKVCSKVFNQQEHTINMEKALLQCRHGCAIQISYIISMDEGVQYRANKNYSMDRWWLYLFGKMISYRQSIHNLDLIVLLLYPDLDEISFVYYFDYNLIP